MYAILEIKWLPWPMGEMAQSGREVMWVSVAGPHIAFLCHGRNRAVQEESWAVSTRVTDMPGGGSWAPHISLVPGLPQNSSLSLMTGLDKDCHLCVRCQRCTVSFWRCCCLWQSKGDACGHAAIFDDRLFVQFDYPFLELTKTTQGSFCHLEQEVGHTLPT